MMYSTEGHSRAQSPSSLEDAQSRNYHPYFTQKHIEYLSGIQRGKLSSSQEEKVRQNACGLLETIGARIGFPRRTIATAEALYHRFHLFFPRKDFNYADVCVAALYVSTKMHDTLKKPRELLAVSYSVRFPELAAKSKHPGGEVDLDTMDPQVVENDRQRLLAVEKLILETICFNFTSRMPFPYLIKIARAFGATKPLAKLGWRIVVDCYRTLLPLQYPPHTLALSSLYTAALLSSFEQPESPNRTAAEGLVSIFSAHGDWEEKYQSAVEDLEDITHSLLDLIIQHVQNPSASTSPSTPSSPSPHVSRHHTQGNQQHAHQPPPYNSDQLIRLKIAMREKEHPPRKRQSYGRLDVNYTWVHAGGINYVSRQEGTVRYIFTPPEVEKEYKYEHFGGFFGSFGF